jgi:hypothetical protein
MNLENLGGFLSLRFPFTQDRVWPLCAFLLFGLLPSPAPAQELDRLFFTPERRQALDRQRQSKLQEHQEIPEDPTLTIEGVVTRSSGKRTVWINGVAQNDRDSASGVVVAPNRANPGVIIVLPESGPATQASVGDTVNRNTGEVTDLLQGGRIDIKTLPIR